MMVEDLFKIEDARPEDVVRIRSIIRDSWLKIYPNEDYGIKVEDIAAIDWFNNESLEVRRKEIIEKTDSVHIFVVKNDKKDVVAFCKVLKHDDCGEIDAIYIVPEFQRKEIGQKLIRKAFEWLGPDLDIKLVVVKYNYHAIEFYKKFGFKETTKKVIYDGTQLQSGKEIPRIEMVRLKN